MYKPSSPSSPLLLLSLTNIPTILFSQLSRFLVLENATRVNYPSPSFLSKFVELHKVMWNTNAGLTGSHPYESRPTSWFFLSSGISFWASKKDSLDSEKGQIYLVGNPIVWWAGSLAVGIFLIWSFLWSLTSQRQVSVRGLVCSTLEGLGLLSRSNTPPSISNITTSSTFTNTNTNTNTSTLSTIPTNMTPFSHTESIQESHPSLASQAYSQSEVKLSPSSLPWLPIREIHSMYLSCWFLIAAWGFHYFPFFLLSRQVRD